jgi:hypothetical protein
MLFGNPLLDNVEPVMWGGGWINQLPGLDDVSNLVSARTQQHQQQQHRVHRKDVFTGGFSEEWLVDLLHSEAEW